MCGSCGQKYRAATSRFSKNYKRRLVNKNGVKPVTTKPPNIPETTDPTPPVDPSTGVPIDVLTPGSSGELVIPLAEVGPPGGLTVETPDMEGDVDDNDEEEESPAEEANE